jgi:GTP pyrophosphokinase
MSRCVGTRGNGKNGEAYVTHALAVAGIVVEAGGSPQAVCAALLHDLVDDTPYTFAQMRAEFGDQVAEMVDGMEAQAFHQNSRWTHGEGSCLPPTVAGMILVKLADRLHNMRTLKWLDPAKQIRKSQETLELAAPIAHRLGLDAIKWELEELALAVLRPMPTADRPTRASWQMLRWATLLLPKRVRARWAEEWAGEMFALRTPAQRFKYAWQTMQGVPRMALAAAPQWVAVLARLTQTLGILSAVVAITVPTPVAAWILGGIASAALTLIGAVLFTRSETPARRLADLIRAFRR